MFIFCTQYTIHVDACIEALLLFYDSDIECIYIFLERFLLNLFQTIFKNSLHVHPHWKLIQLFLTGPFGYMPAPMPSGITEENTPSVETSPNDLSSTIEKKSTIPHAQDARKSSYIQTKCTLKNHFQYFPSGRNWKIMISWSSKNKHHGWSFVSGHFFPPEWNSPGHLIRISLSSLNF